MSSSNTNMFVDALKAKEVDASVVDFDHYRLRGGLSVETDYIISVRQKEGEVFDDFKISKTYSAFRTFSHQLKKGSTRQLDSGKNRDTDELGADTRSLLQFAESVSHMIDSQRTQYIGKVNYSYVKGLAQQRSQIIDDVLDLTLANFPDQGQSPAAKEVSQAIETFFLTDHVEANGLEDEEGTTAASETEAVPESRPSKLLHNRANSGDSGGGLPLLSEAKKFFTPAKKKHRPVPANVPLCSPVVPITRKQRRSISCRSQDDLELRELGDSAKLLLDDDRGEEIMLSPNYSQPVPTVHFARNTTSSAKYNWLADLIEYNPWIFLAIFVLSTLMVRSAGMLTVTIDVDVALLFLFASFCIGLHMPRPSQSGIDTPAVAPKPKVAFAGARNKRKLLRRGSSLLIRRSMLISPKATPSRSSSLTIDEDSNRSHTRQVMELTSVENEVFDGEEAEDPLIQSPMPMFPPDAELGSILNRWSAPPAAGFHVRGANYLHDRKKVESQDFLFPVRGVDLFLTDTCPENVGRNSGVMGGQLRDVATFIVNYRLPWGVLLFYFEIPERFHPFVRKGFDPLFGDDEKLPDMESMTPGDRTVCRFLMGDSKHRDETLKIVPVVVVGPWIVRSAVGGKPAILGTKLPVNYVYSPKEGDDKQLYLEADLDIVASSAARGILSVVRSYTQSLTMDLGFVVQGNEESELPEQMLGAVRMHGIDPYSAPPLPPMKDAFDFSVGITGSPSDDVTLTPGP